MKGLIPLKSTTAIIFISLLHIIAAGGISCSSDRSKEVNHEARRMQESFQADFLVSQARKVFDHVLAHPYIPSDRNWIRATLYAGVMDMYHATTDSFYLERAKNWGEKHKWQVGTENSGFRSSHHIWNEAQQSAVFEAYASAYASAYAEAGVMEQAGAFKRAANLALSSVMNWIRHDGSGCIVKNRYPDEKKWGYEICSKLSAYNLMATSMLAMAWEFARDDIEETASPSDIGRFAF